MMTYRLAHFADDDEIRALLQDNAMQGWVRMSMTREPSFFAGMDYFGKDWAVIAEEGDSSVGMYQCSEQILHINAEQTAIGYLGGLRVKPQYRGRLPILKQGYQSVERLAPNQNLKLWYTSIASDNLAALRILEANLKGMPKYHFLGELMTLALPTSRKKNLGLWQAVVDASDKELQSICDFYNTEMAQHQLSPVLNVSFIKKSKIPFYVYKQGGEIQAVMGLWNQQSFKQVVAKRLSAALSVLRPVYNIVARLTKRVSLPALNEVFDQVFLSFFASKDQTLLPNLIADALWHCPSQVMTFALDAKHPMLPEIQKIYCPLYYQTRIYQVSFGDSKVVWNAGLIFADASIL